MGSHEPWQQSLTAQLVSVLKGKEKNMIQLQYVSKLIAKSKYGQNEVSLNSI
jgi:hypothetical protein